ncbi:MAG: hypothetical protein LCH63_12120 [Candidatus Melainabacteria bacterium]|nr:hypothetical protein [Candidatus Melainabacteria bacterium]
MTSPARSCLCILFRVTMLGRRIRSHASTSSGLIYFQTSGQGQKVGKSAAISQKRWRLSDGGMPPDHADRADHAAAVAVAVPPGFAFF